MYVTIDIDGRQQTQEGTDRIALTTEGEMTFLDGGYRLTYMESAVTGMEGVQTTVEVVGDRLLLRRTGAYSSLLILEKEQRYLCQYEAPYGQLMLGVYTSQLEHRMTPEGGFIRLAYTIDFGGDMTSRHLLTITVSPHSTHSD